LQINPKERLPLDRVMQHPWVRKWDADVYERAKSGGYLADTPAHKLPSKNINTAPMRPIQARQAKEARQRVAKLEAQQARAEGKA
jgi:hypothetical protein